MNEPRERPLDRPVIFGEVLFDCFADGTRVLGGAPFNVAWHLHALGAAPRLVTRIGGDDAGQAIIHAMHGVGMDASFVQHDASHATGVVQVTLNDGHPQFEIVDDCAYDHLHPEHGVFDDASVIYHGTLALRHDASRHALDQLIERLDAPIFMDVNLRDPWWRRDLVCILLDRTCWVKLNDIELGILSENGNNDHDRAMALLDRHRLERVIVTRGDRGAFTIDADGAVVHAHPHKVDTVVDTVGAGDAFAAICIYGIINHWPWSAIMQRAVEFASLLVARRGAIITDPKTYRTLQDLWRLDNTS